jgi:rhodanese-related sulfurtransferase
MAARLEHQYPDVRHVRPEDVFSSGDRRPQQQKQLVDTRTAAERRVSVLPGAIPLSELERRLVLGENEDSNVECVLYCTIGKRSSDEVRRLARLHPRAAPRLCNLRGSVLAWAHAGLPLADENSKSVHCYASPWALLPEGYEPVVFSPLGLLMAALRPQG